MLRNADSLLPFAGTEQRVGQPAVRRYGMRVMRGDLPQLFARSAVVRHIEEYEAAQMACMLVARVDVQHFVDEFEGLIQPVLGPVEP